MSDQKDSAVSSPPGVARDPDDVLVDALRRAIQAIPLTRALTPEVGEDSGDRSAAEVLRSIDAMLKKLAATDPVLADQLGGAVREYGALRASEKGGRPRYGLNDVLSDEDVREAFGPFSNHKWEDVRARVPWSEAFGARHLRIKYGRLIDWMQKHERVTY